MNAYKVYKRNGLWVIKDPDGLLNGSGFEKKQKAVKNARLLKTMNPGRGIEIYNASGELMRVEKPRS